MATVIADYVDFVIDHDLCHLIYNSQPHIDEFETGVDMVVPNDEREAEVYYALLHKHYHLKPGEIIVAEFEGDVPTTRVEPLNSVNRQYEPCLWFPHNGQYYAVMFSASELKSEFSMPQRYRADAGLMHRDYVRPWREVTDAEKRTQSFVLDDGDGTSIITVVWRVPAENSRCTTCYYSCGAITHRQDAHRRVRGH